MGLDLPPVPLVLFPLGDFFGVDLPPGVLLGRLFLSLIILARGLGILPTRLGQIESAILGPGRIRLPAWFPLSRNHCGRLFLDLSLAF